MCERSSRARLRDRARHVRITHMKTSLVLGSALALFLCTGAASAAVTNYKATLNGAQEVPAVTTTATGTATLAFDDATKKLTGTVTLTGITGVNAQHLHVGKPCGENSGTINAL